MIDIRPYKHEDAHTIITWSKDETSFYKWNAGMFGEFPLTEKRFKLINDGMIQNPKMHPFSAVLDNKVIGYFILREPEPNVMRIGFVILEPTFRGQGLGKEMLQKAIHLSFEEYNASKMSIGVFENNPSAYYCYKALGFKELDFTEEYSIKNEKWKCIEMELNK